MLVTLQQLRLIISEGIMLDNAGLLDQYEITNLNESISLEDYALEFVDSLGEFPAMPGMEEQSAHEIAHEAALGYVEIDPESRSLEEIEEYILDVLMNAEPNRLGEAQYRGRDVPLGKPMKGDTKKYKVYVKDKKTGNVKKVNFGDPNMQIRRDNPKARKSFRARHGCGTGRAYDRTKAAYWSCRMWSKKPVSKILKGK